MFFCDFDILFGFGLLALLFMVDSPSMDYIPF